MGAKLAAIINKAPFISQCPGLAQSAVAQMSGDCWPSKPPLLHWQSTRPTTKLHQHGSGQNKADTSTDRGAETTQSMCKSLGLLDGAVLGTHADHLQAYRADPPYVPEDQESSGQFPEGANGEAMPRLLYCVTMPEAHLLWEGSPLASASIICVTYMLSRGMLDRQCVKSMHMTLFHHQCTHGFSASSLKINCRGDTLPEAAKASMMKAIWTVAICLMSGGTLGEQEGPNISEPYDTVDRPQALNNRLIMGKDFGPTLQAPYAPVFPSALRY